MVWRVSSPTRIPAERPLSAERWVEAAMEILVERGVGAIAIEPLAARLGATKGSFYHHFENREGLIRATLEEWERTETDVVLERLEGIPDPGERIRAVMAAAYGDVDGGIRDAALLASAGEPFVRPVVDRVTNRRIDYLTARYRELGLSGSAARNRARLIYTSYLGFFAALRAASAGPPDRSELTAYVEEMLRTLVPTGARSGRRG
jgi:AcrR family transcriptional regulator